MIFRRFKKCNFRQQIGILQETGVVSIIAKDDGK